MLQTVRSMVICLVRSTAEQYKWLDRNSVLGVAESVRSATCVSLPLALHTAVLLWSSPVLGEGPHILEESFTIGAAKYISQLYFAIQVSKDIIL